MKNKDNVLRQIDEVDNMLMILERNVHNQVPMDKTEVLRRLHTIRGKIKFINDNITIS